MKKRIVLSFMLSLVVITPFLSACNPNPLPNYTLAWMQVSAYTEADGRQSHWDIHLSVKNSGGTKGILDDGGTTSPVPIEIPILFTASFPEDRPDCCLPEYSGYPHIIEQRWVPVLTGADVYAFSDVFQFPELVHHDCVPKVIIVQWDMVLPGYISTIEEENEFNNIMSVQVDNWPFTHIWTYQVPRH